MIIIGIDPGLTGALACLDIISGQVTIDEIPTKSRALTGSEVQRRVDGQALAALVRQRVPAGREAATVCENVRSFGRSSVQRPTTTDSLQRTLGAIEAVFDILRWPCLLIEPRAWQAHFGLVGKKAEKRERGAMPAAILTALRLYPQMAPDLSRVKDHNRAEALLIADYGRTVLS